MNFDIIYDNFEFFGLFIDFNIFFKKLNEIYVILKRIMIFLTIF